MVKKRNYKREYKQFTGKPLQIKRRTQRGQARRLMEKVYGKAAIRGKDINHKDHNTANNSLSNLEIMSVKKNRADNKKGLRNSKKMSK